MKHHKSPRAHKRRLKNGTRDFSKPASQVSVAKTPWDIGASGRANRHGLIIEDAADIDPETGEVINPNAVKRARRVDMLERWHRLGQISTAGFNAAEKLRDAFEATQRAPGWPDNDRVQSSPKPDHAVTIQIDRLSVFREVNRCVTPADRSLIDACVLDRHTPQWAFRQYRHDPDAGVAALRAALDRLADRLG